MTTVTHPQDALAFVRREFPDATMEMHTACDGRLTGWVFRTGRSKHFEPEQPRTGGVSYERVRLWRDAQVYARDKRAAKRHV